MNEAGLMFE